VSDLGWLDAAFAAARPQAIAALLRYFRDLDTAEEAFQEACLRALQRWPQTGPPRDPAAWLILVGRNAALDEVRQRSRHVELPPDDLISDLEDTESDLVERLDASHYRDDILRLLFICCHPALPVVQQIALALRVVSGLSVRKSRARSLSVKVRWSSASRVPSARIAAADIPFETPGATERAARLGTVAAMALSSVQRRLFRERRRRPCARRPVRRGDPPRAAAAAAVSGRARVAGAGSLDAAAARAHRRQAG
jgi:RNA polymerase sigma-70 factor (ECF subfamily)